jgi:pre-mycofactocin synthase
LVRLSQATRFKQAKANAMVTFRMHSQRRALTSVADAERRAEKYLPRPVFQTLRGGRGAGISPRENVNALSRIGFLPRVCSSIETPSLQTSILGTIVSMPVLLSPAGVHAVHPDGETAVARAAEAFGTVYGVSAFASQSIESIAAIHPNVIAQLYWMGSRDYISGYIERLRKVGVQRIAITVDWSHQQGRDWTTYPVPDKLNIESIFTYLPHAAARPAWLLRWLSRGKLPSFTLPNLVEESGMPGSFGGTMRRWTEMPSPTWSDIAWLRDQWEGPIMIKGILHPDDARQAIDTGMDAISVSNHGGNDLDGAIAPIHALRQIVTAVDGKADVLMDGGVRRGADVARALAMGAKAVLIGRPYLWALGVRGSQGVSEILKIFKSDLERTLVALGVKSVSELTLQHLCDMNSGTAVR